MAGIPGEIVKWVKENIIHGGPLDVSAWAEEWGRKEGITGIAVEGNRVGLDDELDAFRHAFVSAFIVGWMPFGAVDKSIADWLGQINESKVLGGDSAEYCAKYMDLYNNEVGRNIAPTLSEMMGVLIHFEDPTPFIAKRVAVAVRSGETINSFDDPRMPKYCHPRAKLPGGDYTWHTRNDDKVRWGHAIREGKRFSIKSPPPDGPPGAAYGCRCVAVPIPPEKE